MAISTTQWWRTPLQWRDSIGGKLMYVRLMAEALLGSTASLAGMRRPVQIEKKLSGGKKAMTARTMMSRQMIMALVFRKMKEHRSARS